MLLAILAAYSNHFDNTFHFDDSHTVVDNPAVRSLANIPRFFFDATTFSVDRLHQTYRPLITASLAIDYAIGHGLGPFWFHVSTFFWFLVQLLLMYALYLFVLDRTPSSPNNWWAAWLAVAIYGLHPVSAETVNYIVQRGDLYATLGVVAGVVLYAWKPKLRRFGLYLMPALAGMLAKPSALIFAPILMAYIFLVDLADRSEASRYSIMRRLTRSARLAAPAFIFSAAYGYFQKIMTPATVVYDLKVSPYDYWISQPYVTLRYFRSFFLPLYLKLDTDLTAFHSIWNTAAMAGIAFCALIVAAALFTASLPKWRTVSFGLWWFLIGLLPTAIQPLEEVENDHRMFLPFVGLSLAVVCTARILFERGTTRMRTGCIAASLMILPALAWGTYQRNEVWHTEESLWRDDVEKSPNNARGHYGLAYSLRKRSADYTQEAIAEYRAALGIKPDYVEARTNLASLLIDIPGRIPEAISECEEGIRLTPESAELHTNLGAALSRIGRTAESISEYETALRIDPSHSKAHIDLGNMLSNVPGRLPEAIAELEAGLRIDQNCAECRNNLGAALAKVPGRLIEAISNYRAALQIKPDFAEAHYNLAGALFQIPGREQEAISECEAALRVNPNLAEAQYSLGVVLSKMPNRSEDALTHLEIAQRLRPDPSTQQMIEKLQRQENGR